VIQSAQLPFGPIRRWNCSATPCMLRSRTSYQPMSGTIRRR